jgi:hypothetical protein
VLTLRLPVLKSVLNEAKASLAALLKVSEDTTTTAAIATATAAIATATASSFTELSAKPTN